MRGQGEGLAEADVGEEKRPAVAATGLSPALSNGPVAARAGYGLLGWWLVVTPRPVTGVTSPPPTRSRRMKPGVPQISHTGFPLRLSRGKFPYLGR